MFPSLSHPLPPRENLPSTYISFATRISCVVLGSQEIIKFQYGVMASTVSSTLSASKKRKEITARFNLIQLSYDGLFDGCAKEIKAIAPQNRKHFSIMIEMLHLAFPMHPGNSTTSLHIQVTEKRKFKTLFRLTKWFPYPEEGGGGVRVLPFVSYTGM